MDEEFTENVLAVPPLYVPAAVNPEPAVKSAKLDPNDTPEIVELAKLALGIEPNVNVMVSFTGLPTISRPAPDADANVKISTAESANTFTPLIDMVANTLGDPGTVAVVRYPTSLFNCEILLPDTTTFFQVAILFSSFNYTIINMHYN
jgi:hypothetical protein